MSYIDEKISAKFISSSNQKSTAGVVIIRKYDDRERNHRMLKYGGACLAGAIISVFLPLLHFVLVPGFLIAAISTVVINSRSSTIESAKAKCPQCGVDFVISKVKPIFPLDDICAFCHHKIIISEVNR